MTSRTVFCWAILLVLVGVATPSPFKKEEQEPTVYYQVQSHPGYGEHSGYEEHHGYEEHDDDHHAILAAKDETEDVIWLNTKIVEGLFIAGWIFWVYHIMRPEQLIDIEEITGRQNSQGSPISKAMQLALNSVDPIDMGMDFMEVQDSGCRARIVCEVREMVKRVPAAEAMVDQYGWSLQDTTYSQAVQDGKDEVDCGFRYRECSSSPVSTAYGLMRMLSAMY